MLLQNVTKYIIHTELNFNVYQQFNVLSKHLINLLGQHKVILTYLLLLLIET